MSENRATATAPAPLFTEEGDFDEERFLAHLKLSVEGQENPDGTTDATREIRTLVGNIALAAALAPDPDVLKKKGLQVVLGRYGNAAVTSALQMDEAARQHSSTISSTEDYLKLLKELQ